MALPTFNMRQLLEAGVHFGHQTHRWNPKMGNFIFGSRSNIHIIDLAQTVPLLHQALVSVSDVVARGGRVLFVGTKRQASDVVADTARQCAQYYVNHRWLGGTLTNWKTISNSIRRLRALEELLEGEALGLTKKELLKLTLERDKLERSLGGIKDMGGVPDILFVVDTNKESIAVAEARKLKIPVIGIIDSNSDPDSVTYPVPGNDDAGRAITLYCDLIARAAIDGIERAQGEAGIDIGESEAVVGESLGRDDRQEQKPQTNGKDSSGFINGSTEDEFQAKVVSEQPVASGEHATADAEAASGTDGSESGDSNRQTGFKGLPEAKGEPDDLKKISGVGPVLEGKLNELGIFHYWQVAELSAEEIASIDEALSFKGRIERDDWVAQAKNLEDEKS